MTQQCHRVARTCDCVTNGARVLEYLVVIASLTSHAHSSNTARDNCFILIQHTHQFARHFNVDRRYDYTQNQLLLLGSLHNYVSRRPPQLKSMIYVNGTTTANIRHTHRHSLVTKEVNLGVLPVNVSQSEALVPALGEHINADLTPCQHNTRQHCQLC